MADPPKKNGASVSTSTTCHTTISSENGDSSQRMVAVRYYLDRPGADLEHSSARLWRNPPTPCTPQDVSTFLKDQGIMEDQIVVEIFLDKFQSYMLLEACEDDKIVFDFSNTSVQQPGILNIRLTDVSPGGSDDGSKTVVLNQHNCNTSPVGLFAFSMTVALEAAHLLGKLVPNSVDPSFDLTWGPYAFWLSGLLQLIVGMFEVTRSNVYGATAFMAFGSFWLANGTRLILLNYFPGDVPDELLSGSDPVGYFIRNFYIFAFASVLFKQTLVTSKLTTALITLLCCQTFVTSFAGWSIAFEWIQMIFSWIVSIFAFYVFTAEMTNEVYQRQVFNMHPWTKHSPDEVFGAAGRANTLQSKAAKLRATHHGPTVSTSKVRTALPESK